jgi:hypothetical protein
MILILITSNTRRGNVNIIYNIILVTKETSNIIILEII